MRQVSYDWVNEADARMAIERLDTPSSMKRQTAHTVQTDLAQIANYANNWLIVALRFIDNYYLKKDVVNKIESYFIPGGGKSGQLYGGGFFDLEEDEALIYEARVPGTCQYWNVQLTDELWVSMDWTYHQSSINGFQAKVDDDGVFRAVISQRDPGVPNWLDTVGYSKGSILHRWAGCDEFPEPTAKKVKLANLREHLPKNTPSVSNEHREQVIRQRTLGAQLRRRW